MKKFLVLLNIVMFFAVAGLAMFANAKAKEAESFALQADMNAQEASRREMIALETADKARMNAEELQRQNSICDKIAAELEACKSNKK